MERITLSADKRDRVGKGVARSLRREGFVPSVLYRSGYSIPIKVNRKELLKFISSKAGDQIMVNLEFPDGDKRLALLKDYQVDPVSGELLHSDFFEVLLTEKVRVTVAISTTGEPIGVKRDGGILQYGIREIEIECLPDKIPGHITVDVSSLELGKSIHVRDLSLEEDIKVLTNPDEVIATVTSVVEEVTAPAATEVPEPEVIKKGKKEEKGTGEKG